MSLKSFVKEFHHFGLPTKDMDATIEFYQKLGAEIVFETVVQEAGKPCRVVHLKVSNLYVEAYERDETPMCCGAIDHLAVSTDDTVVFINGCFWHGHEGCRYFKWPKSNQEFWKDKINANRERDKRNLDELAATGWHVITVWECDLKERREKTLDALVHEIRQQPHRIYKKKKPYDTEEEQKLRHGKADLGIKVPK